MHTFKNKNFWPKKEDSAILHDKIAKEGVIFEKNLCSKIFIEYDFIRNLENQNPNSCFFDTPYWTLHIKG